MRLSEMLSRLEIDHLVRIAWRCGIVCGTHSKRQLTRAIHDNFRKPEFLRHVMKRWSEHERATLAYLMLAPEAVWSASVDHPADTSYPPVGGYHQLMRQYGVAIRDHGFLLPIDGRDSDEALWVIPDDLRELLESIVLKPRSESAVVLPGEPDRLLRGGQSFLEDLFTLLVFACKDKIRLTQTGSLFKRSLESLEEFFLAGEDALEPMPQNCLGRLEFMLGFVKHFQILEVSENELVPTKNLKTWMLKPDDDKFNDLFLYLRREILPHDPAALRVMQLLQQQDYPGDSWRPLAEPLGACYGNVPGRPWWMAEVRSQIYWLFHVLMQLGFLELGWWENAGETGFRWLPRGRELICGELLPEEEPAPIDLTVQPDFEVFAPSDISLDLRWQLEQMADLVSRDVVFRYRLSRESVYRGLRWGVTQQDIFAFFEKYCKKGLPQNVLHDVSHWCEHYGDITFADVMLLRCRDEQVAKEIGLVPDIAPLIQGKITSKDLIIAHKDYDRVLKILQRNGYMPRPGVVRFDSED